MNSEGDGFRQSSSVKFSAMGSMAFTAKLIVEFDSKMELLLPTKDDT